MLKSFVEFLGESKSDEEQVLRELLAGGLISKSEFYTLARESSVPLHPEDFAYRYKVSLNDWTHESYAAHMRINRVDETIDSIPQTKLLDLQQVNHHRYIADIASNLKEKELIMSIETRKGTTGELELYVTEIILHQVT